VIRALPLLLLAACADDLDIIPIHFSGPVAAAVLPANAGPWEVPAGFVANSRDGTIVPLDLKMGRLLSDDPSASFLRSAALTTGHERILSDVAVVAGDDGTVTVWAVDQAFQQVLRVPYVTGVDDAGWPVEPEPTATDPVFVDADGSGDAPTLTELNVRAGFTTTEDWSIAHDGTRWWAAGSRSGQQTKEPVPGTLYQTDDGELQFLLAGTGTEGDRFDLRTDTGVAEYTFGARPTALLAHEGRVYVSLASQPGQIVVYDGATGDYVGSVSLGEGAQPGRMTADPAGRLYVADATLPQVWLLRFDLELDPAAVAIEAIPVAAPAVDIAWQGGLDRTGVPFDRLFVAPAGLLRVDVYDPAAGTWVDPNPYTAEAEGVFIGAPIVGLAASAGETFLPHPTAWEGNARVPTVAAATADGFVYLYEASTGCGVLDYTGPYGEPATDTDAYIYLDDQGDASDSSLEIDPDSGWQVVGSTCGGVTRGESWTVIYDSATLSWEVEGTLSGVQAARAVEGQRYLSDTGAVSFTIRSGTLPPTQGDRFTFLMDDGALVFLGSDENEDGQISPAWESPGRPVGFETLSGPSGGGWDDVDIKQYVLLPVINTDIAARLHLETGKTEVLWE